MPSKATNQNARKKKGQEEAHAKEPVGAATLQARDDSHTFTERGRATMARILTSAVEIFVTEGYGGLSMRKVAVKAGLALSNLQHYFPSREDLLAALINATLEEYSKTYQEIVSDLTLTPVKRLEKTIRVLIEDSKQPLTQGLFVNFWAMAQTQEFARKSMEEGYEFQRHAIGELVAAVNPQLSPSELACRAALITCQIEGLFVLIPQRNRFPSDLKGIEDEAVKAIMAVVTR
ncbi:TetR/AcrR family transcriptional regulator [Paraburkholderia flava]|uniref:TetR/AcrR family transcriptional regulator n=1 Tax=Paraburkholderia flava TaxID=2547393 RepID=UPI00105FBC67|nr:TetR/AcrR family transcriptional regulator [Paraburkholderia flava]